MTWESETERRHHSIEAASAAPAVHRSAASACGRFVRGFKFNQVLESSKAARGQEQPCVRLGIR